MTWVKYNSEISEDITGETILQFNHWHASLTSTVTQSSLILWLHYASEAITFIKSHLVAKEKQTNK